MDSAASPETKISVSVRCERDPLWWCHKRREVSSSPGCFHCLVLPRTEFPMRYLPAELRRCDSRKYGWEILISGPTCAVGAGPTRCNQQNRNQLLERLKDFFGTLRQRPCNAEASGYSEAREMLFGSNPDRSPANAMAEGLDDGYRGDEREDA